MWLAALGAQEGAADQRDPILDSLFALLQQTHDPGAAVRTTDAIRQAWRRSDVPGASESLARGLALARRGRARDAVAAFDAAIAAAPDFADAYVRRASVYVRSGQLLPAIADAEAALKLEPRHFDAFGWLGQVYLILGDERGAESAFAQALALNPFLEDVRSALEDLKRERARREL